MSLIEEITMALQKSMKEKDAETCSILRMVLAAIKNEQIDKQGDMTDDDAQAIIRRQVKQLKEAAVEFAAGGRNDLVEKNNKEAEVLSAYLPAQLSDEDLAALVDQTIATVGATSQKDMGMVMAAVMKEAAGKADGGRVRECVSQRLFE